MCVIAVKCMGSDFAPAEAIQRCIEANPHGFAMAWNEDGRVKTFKTMDPKEALDVYKSLTQRLDPATTAMLFHARIATHGSHRIENCHCWVHHGPHGDICFAHNGILHNIPNRDDLTDSETFFQDYFIPALETIDSEDPEMRYSLKLAKAIIGDANNKFAFLNGDGRVWMSSGRYPFIKMQFPGHKGKIYFSNEHWCPRCNFSTALGFDPYKDVTKEKKSAKASSSTTLPSVGKRHQPGGSAPIIAKNNSIDILTRGLFSEYKEFASTVNQ